MFAYAVLNFFVSVIACIIIIRLSRRYPKLITDELHKGPQSFHLFPTPRLGGVALFLAILFSELFAIYRHELYLKDLTAVFLGSVPVFLIGLVEDLTKGIAPRFRLITFLLIGAVAYFVGGIKVTRLDVPFLDTFMKYSFVSFCFTVIAITGLINAINIIDGLNGLASVVSFSIFLGCAYVAYKTGDYFIATLCVAFAFALLGFILLNYPFGLIFLGDSGAYIIGYYLACVVILLVLRHKEISPWFALSINSYPVYETLFSIYRRKKRGRPITSPDALHLHTLMYRIVVKKVLGINNPVYKNPAVSPLLWILNLWAIIPSVLFYKNSPYLAITFFAFCGVYTWIYYAAIKTKLPKWYYNKSNVKKFTII